MSRLAEVIEVGGDITALSTADFERVKHIVNKGRGKGITATLMSFSAKHHEKQIGKGKLPPNAMVCPRLQYASASTWSVTKSRSVDFVKAAWHHAGEPQNFQSNWHIDCVSDHLMAVARREIKGPGSAHLYHAAAAHEVARRQRILPSLDVGAESRSRQSNTRALRCGLAQ